ncbi:MAG: serine/threonine protein kinase, partial [Mycolicibacterium hassiacum]|nr:serine/threonine protein kinase [Mycolicibacterium hassiacum]
APLPPAPAAPVPPPPPQQTREFSRSDIAPVDVEYQPPAGQFAGIDLEEFYWARQRSRRAFAFWVVAVITLTALIAAAAWTLGSNITAFL